MQLLTEDSLVQDTDVRTRICMQEQFRQAEMLRQIENTAAGIKSAVTICMTALVVLFLVVKVFPQVRANAAVKNQSAVSSTLAALKSSETKTLLVAGK